MKKSIALIISTSACLCLTIILTVTTIKTINKPTDSPEPTIPSIKIEDENFINEIEEKETTINSTFGGHNSEKSKSEIDNKTKGNDKQANTSTIIPEYENNLPSSKQNNNDEQEFEIVTYSYAYRPAQEVKKLADLIVVGEFTGKTSDITTDKDISPNDHITAYTDYEFNVDTVLKGLSTSKINVRLPQGKSDNVINFVSGTPKLEAGKKYYLYLYRGTNKIKNDSENYYIAENSSYCFEIDDSGKISPNNFNESDTKAIQDEFLKIK